MFDLERFKQQLAETIAWCAPRVRDDDVGNSLRTVLPEKARELRDYDLNMKLVSCAVEIRAILLDDSHKEFSGWNKPIPPLPTGLGGGRLLIFYPGSAIYDPAAEVDSSYFNIVTIPAWDTWVYHGSEITHNKHDFIHKVENIEYLICWIPSQIIEQVDSALKLTQVHVLNGWQIRDLNFHF